jgi:hypothetical protein
MTQYLYQTQPGSRLNQANVVGGFGGDLSVRQACFTSNSNILTIFSGTGGTFVAQNNSAVDELSTLCQAPGSRVANETSGCFTPGGICLVDCLPGADDSETCLAQVILTEAPSAIMTEAPSSVQTTSSLSVFPSLFTPTDNSAELFSDAPSASPTDLPSSAASVVSNRPQSESQSESPSTSLSNFTNKLPTNFPTVIPVRGGPTTNPSPAPTVETTLLPLGTLAPTVIVSPTGDLTFSPGPVPFPSRPQPPMSNIAPILLPRPPMPNMAPMLLPSTRRPVRPSPTPSSLPRRPQSGCSPGYYDDRNGRNERGGPSYLKPHKLVKYKFKKKYCGTKGHAKKSKKAKKEKSKKKTTKKKKQHMKKSTTKSAKGQPGKDSGNAKFHGIFGGGEGHVELAKKKGYWGPLGGAQGAYRDHHMGIMQGGRQGMNHDDGNVEHPLVRWNLRDYRVADEKAHQDEIELVIVGGRRTLQHLLQEEERRQQ